MSTYESKRNASIWQANNNTDSLFNKHNAFTSSLTKFKSYRPNSREYDDGSSSYRDFDNSLSNISIKPLSNSISTVSIHFEDDNKVDSKYPSLKGNRLKVSSPKPKFVSPRSSSSDPFANISFQNPLENRERILTFSRSSSTVLSPCPISPLSATSSNVSNSNHDKDFLVTKKPTVFQSPLSETVDYSKVLGTKQPVPRLYSSKSMTELSSSIQTPLYQTRELPRTSHKSFHSEILIPELQAPNPYKSYKAPHLPEKLKKSGLYNSYISNTKTQRIVPIVFEPNINRIHSSYSTLFENSMKELDSKQSGFIQPTYSGKAVLSPSFKQKKLT